MTELQFHPLQHRETSPQQMVEWLQLAKSTLVEQGMADMEEYGDMLKWGLPKQNGMTRNIHVFHPDWCSFSDRFRGTIHFHGGRIRGTVLAGSYDHFTYKVTPDADGDRFFAGQSFVLERHTHLQREGSSFELPAMVPHWLRPHELTLTYFEEEDNERMGDLVEPATDQTDEHTWTQDQAEALLPQLIALIDSRLERLTVSA